MKKMSINEIRETQVKILDYFADFCEKNNLRYSLCGGTLLGAVRHGGYIPWDDDIDVMMPRPDYMKLINLYEKFSNEQFSILAPTRKDSGYLPFTYSKLCDTTTELIEKPDTDRVKYHIYVDVFPIDGLPIKHIDKYYRKIKRYSMFYLMLSLSNYKRKHSNSKKIIWKGIYILSKMIKPSIVAKIMEKKVMKYDFDNSKYVGNVTSGYGLKEVNKHMDYSGHKEFEGKNYMTINDVDSYLKNLYGDYMKLPPKEKQIRQHDILAYRK